jgi:hypothetical protein
MDDELTTLLRQSNPDQLDKLNSQGKAINQALMNVGVQPDYTADVSEMQKNGFVWDGYRWVKPQ